MATRADLNRVFGAYNITRWADVSNNKDEAEITERVDYVIMLATEEVKAKLRLLAYDVDLALLLPLVIHAVCQRAGDLLYSPRAISDEEPEADLLRTHRKQYEMFFKNLAAGKLDLGLPRLCRPYPKVQNDPYPQGYPTGL